ncbi:MAG TPA: type II toxin-antitoxin system RelE/ParE family toxin [Brevundimonas sp.]
MKVRWTPQAYQDRSDIWDYLAARDFAAAARMDQRFSDVLAPLADFPCRDARDWWRARAN